MCARPTIVPSLAEADRATLEAALRQTLQPSWLKTLPALDERIKVLDENDLRMLIMLTACYWCLGRIQGTLEERQKHGGMNG